MSELNNIMHFTNIRTSKVNKSVGKYIVSTSNIKKALKKLKTYWAKWVLEQI